jgi:hypothetical protein
VTNAGTQYAGAEVVQLYVQPPAKDPITSSTPRARRLREGLSSTRGV